MELAAKEKIFDSIIQNHYRNIFILDLKMNLLTEYDVKTMEKLTIEDYEKWVKQIASNLSYIEVQPFVEQMQISNILKNLDEDEDYFLTFYYTYNGKKKCYYQITANYLDNKKQNLIITLQENTKYVKNYHEKVIQFQKDSERFRFVISNMCENFGEINVKTGETWMTTSNNWEVEKGNLKDQIDWFANNLIVPEQKDDYIKEFELENFVSNLRKNGGFYAPTYKANYPDGIRYLLIINALLNNPVDPTEEYIFGFVQDITQIKNEEEKNKQLINISQQLLAISQTEPVTELLNRTAGDKLITEYLNKQNSDVSGALLLVDIDYFKKFNDNYGHIVGDVVLKHISKSMRDIFHSRDVLCRWGGDEFVIFVPNAINEKNIKNQIVQLQIKMKNHVYKSTPLPITLSIGCVLIKSKGKLNEIFNYADTLLYKVKQNGRNGYIISDFENYNI